MAQALLSTAKPVRLTRNEDGWSLDVEQLVRVESSLFRPSVTTVWGRDVVLFHLSSNQSTRGLAEQATLLIEKLEAKGTREISFRPVNGSWVPADLVDAAVAARQAKQNDLEIRRLEHELSTQSNRIRQLEDMVRSLTARMESGQFTSNAPAASSTPAEQAKSDPAKPDVEPASLPIPEDEKAAEPELSQEEEQALADELSVHVLAPPAKEMASNMRMLLGDDISCKKIKRREGLDLDEDAEGCYMCMLIDDEGETVGAMVADLTSTIRVGGALMMIPANELDQQVAAMAPSEEITDAMSEVFNTLSGAINLVEGNPHIRTGPLEPFDLSKVPFCKTTKTRTDFKDTFGGLFAILSI
ncbi:MAG: hypothetical protein GY822_07740 [Deltaproteobacteria bacterium]|nr:hypothetical protein [Deltaproteobacteria bacterium]